MVAARPSGQGRTPLRERNQVMDDLWGEIDRDLLAMLEAGGAMDPAEIGRQLGVSADAASSWLCSLVLQGKVRIRLVELAA
jgi:DNA-binding Lrp family transcriptional regulator